ncbi:MAG: ABC transporter ATP-binding protein [Pseudomonadota bacterium]
MADESLNSTLRVTELAVDAGPCRLVANLSLSLSAGDWLAVLGRNGAGKTLTLETLCGLRPAAAGTIDVCDDALPRLGRRELAQRITLVTQRQNDAFAANVAEHVALGRYPHRDSLWPAADAAQPKVAAALEAVRLGPFAQRDITTLSGGERQRAAIAQALVQDCPITVLDEPLSHQDPAHALTIAELLAQRSASGGTVVSSLHDVNLTARFASHALLLFGDGRWAFGPADDMLTTDQLSALYGVTVLRVEHEGHALFVADPLAADRNL